MNRESEAEAVLECIKAANVKFPQVLLRCFVTIKAQRLNRIYINYIYFKGITVKVGLEMGGL